MWISLVDTALTFASHAIAATQLAPLKGGKKRGYLIWATWAVLLTAFSTFAPPPRSGSLALGATAFTLACVVHVTLYFVTTTGNIGERLFLILSYATFFTSCCAIAQFFEAFILPDNKWLYMLVYGVASSGKTERTVKVRIHCKSNKLVIRVENTCKRKLDYPQGFPTEKYGVGLLSVSQAVSVHDGELSLAAQDGIFTALALLNLSA